MFTRKRYQFGSVGVTKEKEGTGCLLWRYRCSEPNQKGNKDSVIIGNLNQYPTRALAWKAAEGRRLTVNRDQLVPMLTFGGLADKIT